MSVWQIVIEISGIDASVSVSHSSLSTFFVVAKLPEIKVVGEFVEMVSISFSGTVFPMSFVLLFLAHEYSITMFFIVAPLALIIGPSSIVIVDPLALFQSFAEKTLIDLSTCEDIATVSMI